MGYSIKTVASRRDEQEFLNLPKRLYKGNRQWVCPLDNDIRSVFDPASNELFVDGDARRWLVYNDRGETVGRIAAFYNRQTASLDNEQPTGGCGFFESENDQQIADMLFDAARDWLKATSGGDCSRRDSNSSRCMPTRTIPHITAICLSITVSRSTSTSIPTCEN